MKKKAAKAKKSRSVRTLSARSIDAKKARGVKGGNLAAGIHFKYDLKAQKES
jgi:hypothetical protein